MLEFIKQVTSNLGESANEFIASNIASNIHIIEVLLNSNVKYNQVSATVA